MKTDKQVLAEVIGELVLDILVEGFSLLVIVSASIGALLFLVK